MPDRADVHLGFAGSRRLFDPAPDPAELRRLHGVVEAYLTARLESLRADLALGAHQDLVGVSQVAVGADTVFARACAAGGVRLRVFLPQPAREYLAAQGSAGPDFTPAEAAEAEALLGGPNVIEVRVVSAAAGRTQRFEDANDAILGASAAVLCLLRQDSPGKPGGTQQLLAAAAAAGLPALGIRVGLRDSTPTFAEEWHNRPTAG